MIWEGMLDCKKPTPPTPPHPEPVATADLVAEARERAPRFSWNESLRALLTALANALEDTAAERDRAHARIAELEAGLRTIAQVPDIDHWAGKVARETLGRGEG